MVLIMGVISFAVGLAVGVKHASTIKEHTQRAVKAVEKRLRSGQ